MILKIYHLGGGIKYSGISRKIPSCIKRKIYHKTLKIYDIGGIMLPIFKENSFIKEYNEKGELFNIGYLKDGKIQKEMKKIIEEFEYSTDSIVENSDSISNETNQNEENNELYQSSLEDLNLSRDISNVLQSLSGVISQYDFTINYTNLSDTISSSEDDSETESSISFYDEYEDEYEGEVIHDLPNGKGIFYKDQNTPEYIGYWLDGKRHGKGIYYKNHEKIYYGEWKDNKRVGFGTSFSKGKKTFEGLWRNDFPYSGKIYSIKEEIIYNGLFSNYNGKFIYYHIHYEETYDGFFKNGKRNGYGRSFYDDNLVYYGQWKDDERDGYGEHIFPSGKYKGYFKNNKYYGYGISYESKDDKNGNEILIKDYSGYWKYGENNGEGIEFYENGNIKYEGYYKDCFIYRGIQYYENGSIMYSGNFKQDIFEGEGILYYPNSQNICFEGTFKEGDPFNGIYYKEDGTEEKTKIIDGNYYTFSKTFLNNGDLIYEGYLKNGKYHGEGTLYRENLKENITGTFINGFYWNGKDTLRYINFCSNPIIFKGSLKNEKYFTGIEYVYEVDEDGDIYYHHDPVFYKKWNEGIYIDEEKERKELKQEMKILSYLETKQKMKLEKTYKKDYLRFLEKKYKIINKENLKKKELLQLIEKEYSSQKNEMIIEEGEYDLFGNEIRNPVTGFDGETYDESSMLYLFERDEKMEFKNIPYIYNEQNVRVPNYPIMSNGKPLNGYQKGEIKVYENDRGKYIKVNQRIL